MDASNSALTLHRRIATKGFNPDDFETRQVNATSKDGTRVPMFVVSRRGLKLDGSAATLLYGCAGGEGVWSCVSGCWGVPCAMRAASQLCPDARRPGPLPSLHRYGGFNISLTPSFSVSRVAWMLAYGGAVAIANLRGGGE